MKKIYLALFTVVLLLGCGDNNASNEDTSSISSSNSGMEVTSDPTLSDDLINQIIESIPSPIEISFIIKEVSELYSRADLNDANSVGKYDTQFRKALNLGVYGTDLGYANIYGKNQDALSYLKSVKDLADGLSIGQFFDYNTIKRLAESSNNLDSLLVTTTSNIEKINYHLRKQKRESLSILLVTGGWVEAIYLTTLVYQRTKSPLLKEKIGEQKMVLDQILLVLDVYNTRPDFPELITDLRELEKVFREIEIETTYIEPTTIEKDGVLVVIDNSKTEIKITDSDVDSITSLLKSIRSKITK